MIAAAAIRGPDRLGRCWAGFACKNQRVNRIGPALAVASGMKAVASEEWSGVHEANFYDSIIAPVNRRGQIQFHTINAVMVIVLFLEVAVLMRFFLAN